MGGPEGDNGLSGKKLVVDAYGPRVPVGGGAWSGKDFYKADRAGGLHARRLAKFIVQAGLAPEATVTLQWCPGEREARVLDIHTPPGSAAVPAAIATRVDLSLARSGATFPISAIVELSRWGHFERADVPWETGLSI